MDTKSFITKLQNAFENIPLNNEQKRIISISIVQIIQSALSESIDIDIPKATDTVIGGIKIGYVQENKNYPVNTTSDGKAYVNVPWTDTNTTYTVFAGASSSGDGKEGLVKKPVIGEENKFLKGDGTWANTPYPSLVGVNNTTGLIKNGSSVNSAEGYTPCPIIAGIPYYKDTNTTYENATTTTYGLVKQAESITDIDGAAELSDVIKSVNTLYANLRNCEIIKNV